MSEEEKELVEKFQNLYIKEFNNEPITSDDRLNYIECALITNLIEKLDKELNTLKEIEQLHQEENGKLRVELEQEKEKNKAFYDFIMFTGGKDIKDITATEYIKIKQEGYLEGRQEEHQKAKEIIMNNYISKDKIKEIVLPTPDNPIPLEIQQSEFYKRILSLLEGK